MVRYVVALLVIVTVIIVNPVSYIPWERIVNAVHICWVKFRDCTGTDAEKINVIVNALFFLGLVVTILQQQKGLTLTKVEMKTTNREFCRQTLETALFEYRRQMKEAEPPKGKKLARQILREVSVFAYWSKQMEHATTARADRYTKLMLHSLNRMREMLKEYSTMRRIFASWCFWLESQQLIAGPGESRKEVVGYYIHRLWCLFTQEQRRVLFLQNAFFLQARKKEWLLHYEQLQESKCIRNFVSHYDIKSINVLLLALHPEGPAPNYPLSREKFEECVHLVYRQGKLPYLFDEESRSQAALHTSHARIPMVKTLMVTVVVMLLVKLWRR